MLKLFMFYFCIGYFVKFNTDYRIKHTLTRKYLAVVDCQHKNKGPDKKTCVDCVEGVSLQVST